MAFRPQVLLPIFGGIGAVANGMVTKTSSTTVVARTITGTAGQVFISNGDGVSGNPTLSAPVTVVRINRTFADFAVAGLTATSNLITLPARSIVSDSIKFVTVTPGDSVATLEFSIGTAGTPNLFFGSSNGLSPANTIEDYEGPPLLFLASTTLQMVAVSTVSNLNTMTQGSWDIYLEYSTYD